MWAPFRPMNSGGTVHALLMPTTHENFGHAVVEARAHAALFFSATRPLEGVVRGRIGMEVLLGKRCGWTECKKPPVA